MSSWTIQNKQGNIETGKLEIAEVWSGNPVEKYIYGNRSVGKMIFNSLSDLKPNNVLKAKIKECTKF